MLPASKRCPKCSRELPVAAFYSRDNRPDGLHPWCKDCCRASNRARYAADRANVRARHQRNYAANSTAVKARTGARQRALKAWRLHVALSKGDVGREPCLFCGSEQAEAHHHDYAQPLSVTWLCKRHHALIHRAPPVAEGPAGNADAALLALVPAMQNVYPLRPGLKVEADYSEVSYADCK